MSLSGAKTFDHIAFSEGLSVDGLMVVVRIVISSSLPTGALSVFTTHNSTTWIIG